jgi:hypothetical protein
MRYESDIVSPLSDFSGLQAHPDALNYAMRTRRMQAQLSECDILAAARGESGRDIRVIT